MVIIWDLTCDTATESESNQRKAKIRNEINNNNKMLRRVLVASKSYEKSAVYFTSKFRLNLSQNAFENVLNSSELCFRL